MSRFNNKTIVHLMELLTLRAEVVRLADTIKTACAGQDPGSDEAIETILKFQEASVTLIEKVAAKVSEVRGAYGDGPVQEDVLGVLKQAEEWLVNERSTNKLLNLLLEMRREKPDLKETSFKPVRGLA